MGGARAVVGVVLGLISLAVLSLHIALCIHYPSPLFAVTLLLNPSLWLFLGLIGMGCALLLTHRDQQRKVRAGQCVACHTQYGSTVDTKWRNQDQKWRDGQYYQRGPSRAIYSYNGNLHKFYASYGTINEKQGIEMKHSSLNKTPLTAKHNNVNVQSKSVTANEKTNAQNDFHSTSTDSSALENSMQTEVGEALCSDNSTGSSQNRVNSEAEEQNLSSNKENESHSSENHLHIEKAKNTDNLIPSKESNADRNEESTDELDRSDGIESTLRRRQAELAYQERFNREMRYCDCMARYGVMYHYSHEARTELPPRYHRYSSRDPAMRRYNRKLLMHCKLKPLNDVPVELFAAKKTSVGGTTQEKSDENLCSKESDGTVGCSLKETSQTQSKNNGRNLKKSLSDQREDSLTHNESSDIREQLSDSELGSNQQISKHSLHPISHTANTIQNTTLTFTSVPLGSPYNGENKKSNGAADFDSTSVSSGKTASEHNCQDPDALSVSSKSSLLPSSPEKSTSNKDLTKSPLWRPFKSGILGRKKSSNVHYKNVEGNSKVHQSSGAVARHASASENSQESSSSVMKSKLVKKKSISRKSSSEGTGGCDTNSNIGSEEIPSKDVSSAMLSKPDESSLLRKSPNLPNMKGASNKKYTSSKILSSQKQSKSNILSPAKAVRSLVFRNAPGRVSRSKKTKDLKTHPGDTTTQLPLLTSPAVEDLNREAQTIDTLALSNETACPKESTTMSSHKEQSQTHTSSELQTHSKAQGESSSASTPAIATRSLAAATTTMDVSSSPGSSPSVRPKEPKKPRLKLRGKHRTRTTESIMLLNADSDE